MGASLVKRISEFFQIFNYEEVAIGCSDFDALSTDFAAAIGLLTVFEALCERKDGR